MAIKMTRSTSVKRVTRALEDCSAAPNADQGVAVGQLLVTDQPGLGLVDDAVHLHHAGLATALAAVVGELQPSLEPGVQDALGLVDRQRFPASDEGDLER